MTGKCHKIERPIWVAQFRCQFGAVGIGISFKPKIKKRNKPNQLTIDNTEINLKRRREGGREDLEREVFEQKIKKKKKRRDEKETLKMHRFTWSTFNKQASFNNCQLRRIMTTLVIWKQITLSITIKIFIQFESLASTLVNKLLDIGNGGSVNEEPLSTNRKLVSTNIGWRRTYCWKRRMQRLQRADTEDGVKLPDGFSLIRRIAGCRRLRFHPLE